MSGESDLQVADSWCVVDLNVGGVCAGQWLVISVPLHRGSWVGQHLAGDVDWVPLPGVPCHCALDLWSICKKTQGDDISLDRC